MMKEKQLELEYRNRKRQAAPDLWDRIEGNLKEHPEREMAGRGLQEAAEEKTVLTGKRGKRGFGPAYGMAAAAAAVLVLVIAAPVMRQRLTKAPEVAGGEVAAGGGAAAEAGEAEVSGAVSGDMQETAAVTDARRGSQMAYRPLTVPDQAVTVAEDSRYFSEGILGDTSLLCEGRVLSAAFQEDGAGRISRVVYEIVVDGVYYAEDYISSLEQIAVESPIIRTEGDTAFVLYQLVPGETYLLPLAETDGRYELLYPFAPQIQMVGEQSYVFHSGYVSLVTRDTSVAVKVPEGTNDYYYDRMLVREDDDFLSDLVSLIEREAQGRD